MPRQQVVRGKAPYDVIEVDEMGFPRVVPPSKIERPTKFRIHLHDAEGAYHDMRGEMTEAEGLAVYLLALRTRSENTAIDAAKRAFIAECEKVLRSKGGGS